TLAMHNPRAEIVALDWKNVLAVAAENARTAGVANRFRTLPGSAFEVDYGSGYDLVLLTNILHHFDPAGCEALLGKVHRALAARGRAYASTPPLRPRETSGLVMQLADLFVHDVDVSDPGARDPEFIREVALPFFDALRVHYFRAEIEGADNVPRDRPFIAVANDNGGPLLPDCAVLVAY